MNLVLFSMRIFKPLRHQPTALLWGGQLLSSVGDELHKVAFIWLAAGILGNNTGYLASVQAASVFLLSLFGGIWADKWNHKKTMIWVDIIRGLVVLALPVSAIFGGPHIYVLLVVAVVVSGLNALFDPALRAVIPEVVEDQDLLTATNGLMETTHRLARTVGPGLIGVLSTVMPLIQFFTIDALSFFVSAGSLVALGQIKSNSEFHENPTFSNSVRDGVLGGWMALKTNPLVRYLVISNSVVNAAWYFVFPLALGLEIHEKMPNNVGAFGYVVAAYGVGNVLSNLVVGSFNMEKPLLLSWMGRIACGLGFIGIALSQTFQSMMIFSGISALGGPMIDLSFMTLMQRDYRGRDIAKIFRLDMVFTYGPLLVCYALSPLLFKVVSYQMVIAFCGAVMIAVAAAGFFVFGNDTKK